MGAIMIPQLGFVQAVIATCNSIEKLILNAILAATPGLVLTHDGNANQVEGGGGADVELDACLWRYTSVGAPNWGGRTPKSQTPGVPATMGLDVQKDGIRKMPVNGRKKTLLRNTPRTSR